MKQVEYGIILHLLITGRSVDGHAAVELESVALIPHFGVIAVGHIVYTVDIAAATLVALDNEDVGPSGNARK